MAALFLMCGRGEDVDTGGEAHKVSGKRVCGLDKKVAEFIMQQLKAELE